MMFDVLKKDLARFKSMHGGSIGVYFYYPMFTATIMLRCSQWCYRHHLSVVAYILVRLNDLLHGIWVGPKVKIGPGLFLGHSRGLVVNPDTVIGENCTILQQVTLGGPGIVIGDNVLLAAGAKVISRKHKKKGLRIGNNVKIGAGTIVLEDVPDNCTVIGTKSVILEKSGEK